MTLDEAISELRRRNESVPKPPRLPTDDEVGGAEATLGLRFHPDFRRFLLEASDVTFSVLEPATITVPGAHNDLVHLARHAWEGWEVPRSLLPFCQDNADFYCIEANGRVVFWSHDEGSLTGEAWPSLAAWIEEVWMFDYDAT